MHRIRYLAPIILIFIYLSCAKNITKIEENPQKALNICNNGAINYPACSTCPNNQYLIYGKCDSCTFGTVYDPSSKTCIPSGSSYASTEEFTGLALTTDGWTDLSKLVQDNSRIVYVSTSGNDSTALNYTASSFPDPFNPSAPQAYATLAAAYGQLRNGYPDIMLLKRGDVWSTNWPNWAKSGESKTKRIIVAAYGPTSLARPKTGRFNIYASINYCIFSSLELDADERSINTEAPMTHILFEDIMSPPGTGKTGVIIQNVSGDGGIDYLAIRRSVIAGRWLPAGITGYNQGIYIDDSINLLIEGCVFDQNGWREGGNTSYGALRAHNTYIMLGRTGEEQHIFRYNISTRAQSTGIQAGSGGIIYGNLSVQDGIGIQAAREDTWWYDGYGGLVKHNVILHGRDILATERRGFGIRLNNIHNMIVEDNIIAGNNESGQPYGIRVEANSRSRVMMYVRNLTIKNNIIHNWNGNNIIDGEAISLLSDDYHETTTYHHGSSPDDYITGVQILDNKIHLSNAGLRVIQTDFISDIILSAGNTFHATRAPNAWFYIQGTQYLTDAYKTLYSDTTSVNEQTIPSDNYGITAYLSSIGETPTLESFYTHIRAQRKGNWNSKYTAVPIINFVRDKFDREPINN